MTPPTGQPAIMDLGDREEDASHLTPSLLD